MTFRERIRFEAECLRAYAAGDPVVAVLWVVAATLILIGVAGLTIDLAGPEGLGSP